MIKPAAPILIVDESQSRRTSLREMLTRLGFRNLEEAETGKSALLRIHGRAFALIISDWNMVPMSGIELLREVRRLSVPGFNRFILATTDTSWGIRTTAKLDGADALLVKPFTIGVLRAKIETVLHR